MVNRVGRSTKTRQRTRRAQLGLENIGLIKCPHCGKPTLPHTMCAFCGTYKGRQVVDVLKKLEKKERKKKEKELEQAQAETEKGKPLDAKALSKKEPKTKIRVKEKAKQKQYGHENLNPGRFTGPISQDR